MEITDQNTVKDIKKIPELASIKNYLIYGGLQARIVENIKLARMKNGGWPVESLLKGLERLRRIAGEGEFYYPLYDSEELKGDSKKKDVHIVRFPAISKAGEVSKKPYFIVCAGGAYSSVCSLLEAYPVAARLNELGFDAFTLNYRVGGKGVLPKPMEDLAAAIRYISKNEKQFGISGNDYIVCGFSAGGNLTGQWGTWNHGYKKYDLPKPRALFPIYPSVNMDLFENSKDVKKFTETMFGKHHTKEQIKDYNIDSHADKDYPPSYIVCCKDDNMVPYQNSVVLYEKLKAIGIFAEIEVGDKGGHGFGEGLGTSVEGWLERALTFVAKLG